MTEPIVMIARKAKALFRPIAQRHFGICIITADHQDAGMNRQQEQTKPAQWVTPLRENQNNQADPDRKILQRPCHAIGSRRDSEENLQCKYNGKKPTTFHMRTVSSNGLRLLASQKWTLKISRIRSNSLLLQVPAHCSFESGDSADSVAV